jgi:hypothetical protein
MTPEQAAALKVGDRVKLTGSQGVIITGVIVSHRAFTSYSRWDEAWMEVGGRPGCRFWVQWQDGVRLSSFDGCYNEWLVDFFGNWWLDLLEKLPDAPPWEDSEWFKEWTQLAERKS